MPITEHPFYGSWGYQITGYFAPTARYGTPQDLMVFVDTLHQRGIGVILDWVPSHFPADPHALARFDGTALYEHDDPRLGFHPQWNSLIFNYGRYEVRDFLISNALFWLEKYHFDGLRVDAVASMLYLDFARNPGEWIPNPQGGNQNHEAVHFLQDLNASVYGHFPDVHVIAEESTAWPAVSRPVHHGGLGFGMKWNMGWMNDTLRYYSRPHFFRHWHADDIRFSAVYAFHENFVLPLTHDEVVYGKGSLLGRQPGDEWQRFAGLRNLYGYMWAHPGKKLVFMGGEFGQQEEWHHERTLDWHLWARPFHAGVARWLADLNGLYRRLPALHVNDFVAEGFSWLPTERPESTILTFLRRGGPGDALAVVVCNLTPEPRPALRIALPEAGDWHELLNSDAAVYGGSGVGNLGCVRAQAQPLHGWPASASVAVPPLGVVILSNRPAP
jgi:1,4-alpha-glucan branching enzyme